MADHHRTVEKAIREYFDLILSGSSKYAYDEFAYEPRDTIMLLSKERVAENDRLPAGPGSAHGL
jgi:hypothetical protein